MAHDDFSQVVYEHYARLGECLENYRDQLEKERDISQEDGLRRLIDLQLKRLDRLLAYLDGDGDETLRDLLDRCHVLEQAREGKFV